MFSFVGVLVLGNFLSNCSPSFVCVWFGYFIPFNVIIGVKGIISQGGCSCYYFDVSEEERLWYVVAECPIWQTTM